MKERDIQHAIRLALADEPGLVLWRNSAGVATFGHGTSKQVTRFGLIPGASDLIGLLSIRAGDLDPNTTIGRFVALEIKNERGQLSQEQRRFLVLVARLGGATGIARSVEQAHALVPTWRAGGNPQIGSGTEINSGGGGGDDGSSSIP